MNPCDFLVAPKLVGEINGERLNWSEIVKLSGYRNVVETNDPPIVFIHDKPHSKTVYNCVPSYAIDSRVLSDDPTTKAQQILYWLTYTFHDWASGEVVRRHHRDILREKNISAK